MPRSHFNALPPAVRAAVEAHTGRVEGVESLDAGSVSSMVAVLHTETGTTFCKGIETTSRLAWMHRNEARLNPHLPPTAPRLRWVVEEADWLLLGFDHAPGRHADLQPGSPDLPVVAYTLAGLVQALTPAPAIPIQPATARWASRIAPELIDGDTVAHTDVTPRNFLVSSSVAVVDWAAPCRGAAWIDTAFMVIRLIRAGHSPHAAEAWATAVPAWNAASSAALDTFSAAIADLYEQRRQEHPAPHRGPLAAAARTWAQHRSAAFVG